MMVLVVPGIMLISMKIMLKLLAMMTMILNVDDGNSDDNNNDDNIYAKGRI